ncbi:hypothetical protein BaRGS_00019548 [Batillaria attramentaria]|uniref:Autophagy-related protein 13 n=1 Tax=Batillaria attramentaria TaxID=370345 RepID=A0ABD0KQ22_9CAEN
MWCTHQQWIKSICNHLYWVAVSTPNADGQLMLEKWCLAVQSPPQQAPAQGSKVPAVPASRPGRRREKQELDKSRSVSSWLVLKSLKSGLKFSGCLTKFNLSLGTKLSAKLTDILESRQMMKDVPMLSTGPRQHTLKGSTRY